MNKDINKTLMALVPILRMNGEKIKKIEAVKNWYKVKADGLARYVWKRGRKMNEKLKPCPFCGSKWTQVRYINNPFDKKHVYGGYRAECTDCFAVTRACNNERDAIEAWNRRAEQ